MKYLNKTFSVGGHTKDITEKKWKVSTGTKSENYSKYFDIMFLYRDELQNENDDFSKREMLIREMNTIWELLTKDERADLDFIAEIYDII